MSTSVRRALYGKLAGDTTLTTLLGTPAPGYSQSIYYQLAPQEAGFPFIVFQKQSGTPVLTFKQGHAALDSDLWLVKGVDRSTTADAAEAISDRIDTLLADAVLSISGAVNPYLQRESDIDYSELNEGTEFKHSGALFRLASSRT